MSCDWCQRLQGVRFATATNAGMTNGQRQATFGRAGSFLPRCSRNAHWVSPANPGFCRPCGEDQRNADGSQAKAALPWPPTGIFTRKGAAVAALQGGQVDMITDISHRTPRPSVVLSYDPATGEIVIDNLAAQQAAAAAPEAAAAAPEAAAAAPEAAAAAPEAPTSPPIAVQQEAAPAPAAPAEEVPWRDILAQEQARQGAAAAGPILLDQDQVDAWTSKILSGDWHMGPHTPAQVVTQVNRQLTDLAAAGAKPAVVVPPPATAPEVTMPASLTPMPLPATALQGNPVAALTGQPQGVSLQMATLQRRIDDWYREREALGLIRPITPMPVQPKAQAAVAGQPAAFDPSTLHQEERDRLSRANAVKLTAQGNGVYTSEGSGKDKEPYTIDLNAVSQFSTDLGHEVHGTCTCGDFVQRMGPAGLRCKHLLKAQMEEGTLGTGAAAQVQAELGPASEVVSSIQMTLGITDPPAPSFGDTPAAKIDPTFQLTPEAQRVMQFIGGGLRMGYAQAERGLPTMEGRAFGLFGPPGTGKNTVLRQVGAALGLPYSEITVDKRTDLTQLIGSVTLVEGPHGATVSTATLGPLGRALLEGGVITINEINTMDPYQQSALYQIVQDGTFTIQSPEGVSMGTMRVHPSTVIGVTWNPMGGEADRPIPALYSRLYNTRMDYPPEDEERAMLSKWAEGRGVPVVDDDMTATVRLVRALRSEAADQAIDMQAGYRNAQQFYTMLQATGSVARAAETLQGLASQTYDYATQWATVETYLTRFFGDRYQGVGSGKV